MTTLRLGLIGHNIGYSRSPDIFRAIFDLTGDRGTFESFDLAPDQFDRSFPEITASGVAGLSVTIPYKHRSIAHLDDTDPVARALGAVNSILISESGRHGYNTDVYGFSLPLREHADRLKHGRALILGAGGAARAAIYALYTDYEIHQVVVINRSPDRSTRLRGFFDGVLEKLQLQVLSPGDQPEAQVMNYDILVNCTPLGGANYRDDTPFEGTIPLKAGKIYYDLNYNSGNRLVAGARDAGMIAIDGSTMLVGQGVQSYYLWTGRAVPFEPIYEAVFGRG